MSILGQLARYGRSLEILATSKSVQLATGRSATFINQHVGVISGEGNRVYQHLAISIGFAMGVQFLARDDNRTLPRCDSWSLDLQNLNESVLVLFVTTDRSGLVEDACKLLRSQKLDIKISNVSVAAGSGTRHIYVVQDTVTGAGLSAEKLVLARRALMSLGEVAFVHVVPQSAPDVSDCE